MEVTSHKGSHVPPLIEQELWSILLSRESKIMMCRGIDLRERDHCQWTLPTKLLFSLCLATRAFVVAVFTTLPLMEMIAYVECEVVFLCFFLASLIISLAPEGSALFIFVLLWSVLFEKGGFVRARLAGSDPQASHSLSLCLLCQERSLSDFSQWIAGEFIGGWLAITD